jgi:hypothetical protein
MIDAVSRSAIAGLIAATLLTPLGASAQDSLTGCPASAERAWIEGRTVSAIALGPSCAQAALLITLRDADGALLYADTHQVEYLFGFEEATGSPETMTAALDEWIQGGWPERGGELPAWSDETPGALGGEFPFYVDRDMDEADYTRIREENKPLFCYIQGMESVACLGLYPETDDLWVKIGAQSFPG